MCQFLVKFIECEETVIDQHLTISFRSVIKRILKKILAACM